jgi:UDP-N-acetylglucosamine 4,6-dehydratase
MFKDKTILISGGTGSFGNAVLRRFLDTDIKGIRIFSRDEKKQDDMRKFYNNSKLKFYLGDVRDPQAVKNVVKGVDFIFHAAALKQVPSCEFYPLEAVKTNILGTENILDAAIQYNVERVVCLSTDKAVYPINAMGLSKAMMEKVLISKSRLSGSTVICATRYGNVMASRGSVIPLFVEQIKSGKPITITDPNMTRFMMTLEESVELVLFAFKNANPGDIFVQKSPATSIGLLAKAMTELLGETNHSIQTIGTRHGEKLFEVLLSREEIVKTEDMGNFFRVVPDLRDLNYGMFFEEGKLEVTEAVEYSSHNTKQLSEEDLKNLLLSIPYIQKNLQGRYVQPDF